MLILQIIGGWLAVSSICLNVYYFLTIGYQRRLIKEYREELADMIKKYSEVKYESCYYHDRLKRCEQWDQEVQIQLNRLESDISTIKAKFRWEL